jgi:hypothetical protein
VVALAAAAVGWGRGLDALQETAPYSTGYWYGTSGTVQAARWVDQHLTPDDTYVASKEVAWRARPQRYVDQDTLVTLLQAGRLAAPTWQGAPIAAVVALEREPYVAELLRSKLPPLGFRETYHFDDYVVYEPRPRGTPAPSPEAAGVG